MKTQAWHRTLGLWIGSLVFIYELYGILSGRLESYWIFVNLLVLYIIALSITVGYHRLFTHFSFECSRIWHYIFGIVGCLSLNASPVHWSIVHWMHHKHSDTPLDSHESTWRYFFRFRNKTGMEIGRSSVRLMKDPFHKFLSNYSLLIFLVFSLVLCLIDVKIFLYGFLSPVGVYLFLGGLHTMYSHHRGQPTSYWYLEFIFPSAGEWNHRCHHEDPKNPYFQSHDTFFDLGGYLIKVIRNDDSISKRAS